MKLCGVYFMINTVNKKYYIGASSNLKDRFSGHITSMKNGYHDSTRIQKDHDIYGSSVFKFGILVQCDKHELCRYEQWFIEYFKPPYNSRIQNVNSNKGIALSVESRMKMSIAKRGKKRIRLTKWSDESRARGSLAQRNKKVFKPRLSGILKIDCHGDILCEYKDLYECSVIEGIKRSTIYCHLIGQSKSLRGKDFKLKLKDR